MAKMIKTAAELNADTKAIVSGFKDQGKALQAHLIDIALHIFEHGNVTPATRLVKALDMVTDGESHSVIRVPAVVNWLRTFAACKSAKDGEGFELNKKMRNAVLATAEEYSAHMKEARKASNAWNKLTKAEPTSFSFDLDAVIKAVLERANNAETKAKERANGDAEQEAKNLAAIKIDADKLAALKALAA